MTQEELEYLIAQKRSNQTAPNKENYLFPEITPLSGVVIGSLAGTGINALLKKKFPGYYGSRAIPDWIKDWGGNAAGGVAGLIGGNAYTKLQDYENPFSRREQ